GTEGLPAAYQLKGRTFSVVNATTPHTWGLNSRESGIGSPEPLGKGGYVVFALPDQVLHGKSSGAFAIRRPVRLPGLAAVRRCRLLPAGRVRMRARPLG